MLHVPLRVRWSIVHGFCLVWRRGIDWSIFGFLTAFFVAWNIVVVGLMEGGKNEAIFDTNHEVILSMRSGVSDQKRQEFFGALQSLPFVKNATYITGEKAIERMRRIRPDVMRILDNTEDVHTVSDTIVVSLTSAHDRLDMFLLDRKWINTIDLSVFLRETDAFRKTKAMASIAYGVWMGMVMMLCALGALFVIYMMGLMHDERYQRNTHGFCGILPSVVFCSFWTMVSVLVSWCVVLVFFGLSFDIEHLVAVVSELVAIPFAIGLMGWGKICCKRC